MSTTTRRHTSVRATPASAGRRPTPGLPARLRAPGWYRAALFDVLGFGFAVGLTTLVRWLQHQHPVVDGHAITIVSLIAVPLFFLVGVGVADYWFYWVAGRPVRPEDHSQHGAYS